ncbi:probable sodium/metabolite cotransporter BASS1, chloroplastic [Juglans microcarpa x Juglans regia]|uniref:probable sodium/metabolite cotransporter BASS1, chloroplastic n=1 Tax=Juglans microcarpa x Juglans regia TaxID=2249226 RepID=UPI001B7E592A|nr:probable sodium/metabolite cotransporter BASS1, chloroplastic [Juglans microcarpa x Juglans regia]
MFVSLRNGPFIASPQKTSQSISIIRPKTPIISLPPKLTNLLPVAVVFRNSDHFLVSPLKPRWENSSYTVFRKLPVIRAVDGNSELSPVGPAKPKWENFLATAASLYPVYVIFGWFVACFKPSAFAWFVNRGPASYSLSLGLIMLAMGITLDFEDLIRLFLKRPLSILFGCVAQYTIMPSFAFIISKILGLPPSLSAGLILLGCCPGGTASNVVTLIARGDVPLSIVMTSCTTLGAVLLTPFLTKILAGTYVAVDAIQLSISTLQVVVAPTLLGSYVKSAFPAVVKIVMPFAPLFAVLASSLLACSVFSENFVRLKSMVGASVASDLSPLQRALILFSGELGVVMLSVALLHYAGFLVGYISAAICGFKETERRAISIEVGMQNSSLGVVLAAAHFPSPMVAVPPAISAVVMNVMGSSLGVLWRCKDPLDSEKSTKTKSDNL